MATASVNIQSGHYFDTRHKKYEVFFKGHHVMHYPWKENDEKVPLLSGFSQVPLQNQSIEVIKLCHYTHNEEAQGIDRGDYFLFKPKPKYGKDTSASKRVTAIICNPTEDAPTMLTQYRIVGPNEQILPGSYVWWFIDSSCLPTVTEQDPSVYQSPYHNYTVSDPFITPYQSRYGNKKISANLNQLLIAYNQTLPGTIQFRCGGTLRYNKQICKVIIVCSSRYDSELRDYSLLLSGKHSSINITIQNGIVKANSSQGYSCDTYAFIFHFPNETYELKCTKPRSFIYRGIRQAPTQPHHFNIEEVTHNVSESKVPCCVKVKHPNGSFVCPNDLPENAMKRKRRGGSPEEEDKSATKSFLFSFQD